MRSTPEGCVSSDIDNRGSDVGGGDNNNDGDVEEEAEEELSCAVVVVVATSLRNAYRVERRWAHAWRKAAL